jgi:hypothetical protein
MKGERFPHHNWFQNSSPVCLRSAPLADECHPFFRGYDLFPRPDELALIEEQQFVHRQVGVKDVHHLIN